LPITFEAITVAAVVVSAGTGAAVDVCTRRVPNVLTVSVATLGIVAASSGLGDLTISDAALGFAAGMLLMLPGHLWGGTGGGDVKLLAALGTWLGPYLIVKTFLYSAIAGGVLALIIAVHRRRVGPTLRGAARLVVAPVSTKREVEATGAANRFPYAPAIAAGTVLAVLGF